MCSDNITLSFPIALIAFAQVAFFHTFTQIAFTSFNHRTVVFAIRSLLILNGKSPIDTCETNNCCCYFFFFVINTLQWHITHCKWRSTQIDVYVQWTWCVLVMSILSKVNRWCLLMNSHSKHFHMIRTNVIFSSIFSSIVFGMHIERQIDFHVPQLNQLMWIFSFSVHSNMIMHTSLKSYTLGRKNGEKLNVFP